MACDSDNEENFLSTLRLVMTNDSSLFIEYDHVDPEDLKAELQKNFPKWEGLESTINTVRWVNDRICQLNHDINMEFEDEGIYIQKRDVRSSKENGSN